MNNPFSTERWTCETTALWLGISVTKLRVMRKRNEGPAFWKVPGKRIFYAASDVAEYSMSRFADSDYERLASFLGYENVDELIAEDDGVCEHIQINDQTMNCDFCGEYCGP